MHKDGSDTVTKHLVVIFSLMAANLPTHQERCFHVDFLHHRTKL